VAVQARDSSNNVRTNTYSVTTTGAAAAFTHDANGNLASRAEGGVTTTYHWDAENRLVAVRRGAATLAAFAYDGRGRRATKTASPEGVSYVWDGDDVLQERSSLFANRRYVRGVGVDVHLAVVEGSTPTYYLGDHLGTVVRTTNSAGTPVLHRAYDPWGAPSAGSSVNGYAYTGREWDSETGLYHYRARYYDPKIARFLSEDPIGFAAGTNFYAYVGNNPVTMRDPDGLLPTPDPYYLCYRYGICPPPSAPNCKVTPPPISCAECEKFKRVCYLTAIIGGAAATATCWGLCVLLVRKPPLCSIICGAVGAATAAELKEVCDKTYALCKQKCK
jgi:RHS repeat-associated protein